MVLKMVLQILGIKPLFKKGINLNVEDNTSLLSWNVGSSEASGADSERGCD